MTALLSEAEIKARIGHLADAITAQDLPDINLIALMDGAMIFTADLTRALYRRGLNPRLFTLGISSYGEAKTSSGAPVITKDVDADLAGLACLILDDVLESGATLAFAKAHLTALGAASVQTCVFARKPYKKRKAMADFIGWDAPDVFLIGYGLDDGLRFRGQPYISAAP